MEGMANFEAEVLICTRTFGFFEQGTAYYCFADDGYNFWIHAPFLLDTLGVQQIKVADECRDNFMIRGSGNFLPY